jgi:hypothetical protein
LHGGQDDHFQQLGDVSFAVFGAGIASGGLALRRGTAARVIERSDAPILAAARAARVDYLVTWNTRDFQTDSVRR